MIFGDESDRVEVHHNKVFNTPLPNGATTGAGIWVKHASEIPGATFQFHDNIVRDVFQTGIGGQSSGIHAHHNLIVNAAPFYMEGGSNVQEHRLKLSNIRIENNTFVNTSSVKINDLQVFNYPDAGFMTFRKNIVATNEQSYNQENGIARIDTYGIDGEYVALVKPENLQFDDNVYYNKPVSPIWNVFSQNGGEYGSFGADMTFEEWQALGIDTTSVLADPQLNNVFVPQNPAASESGWTSGSEPRLAMYVQNDQFSEADGQNASTLTLYRTGPDISQPLTVTLSVSDSSEITVPSTATFPAGVAVIHVPLSAVNDGRNEPTRAVQVLGSTATGLRSSEWVRVLQESVTPAAFDAVGTTGSDKFVVRYSGNTSNSSVTVSIATDGSAARKLGTFSMSTALNLTGLGGTDSVQVVGSSLNDRIFVSNSFVTVNGSRIRLNSVEQKTLAAGTGNDNYRFDTDSYLGAFILNESGDGGVDTIDFSTTTAKAITLNLSSSAPQTVNSNLRLTLTFRGTVENVTGGSRSDTLTGNSANNLLRGGDGHDILVGLNGNDRIYGDDDRDLVIGGRGKDRLFGGNGEDVVISGFTTSDTEVSILEAIRKEWTSASSISVRISRLRRGVPGILLKAKVNVLDDTQNGDVLSGGASYDWYFKTIDDSITDFFNGDINDTL